MKWCRSLTALVAASALMGSTTIAATQQSAAPAIRQISEAQRIKDSGYHGWRRQWANINQIGRRNLCGGLNFYSLQRQVAMGKRIAQQVIQNAKLIHDPVITGYINRIGQNIVRNSDARVPYTFHVIDSNVVNAFSLPGGFVFVDSGLILKADDEAELAGVIGHETAHVAACHGAKQQTKSTIAQLAMIPLSIMLPYGWAGYGIYEGVNALVPMAFLKFSRVDESQADYLGVEYMYKAGYDPNAFISFFEKVEAQDLKQPSSVPVIFSDHPATQSRMEAVQKEIAAILPPRPEYVVDTSTFENVKRRLQVYESHRELHVNRNRPTLLGHQGSGNSGNRSQQKPPVLRRRPAERS